jgi:hypothetical protein
MALFLLMMLMQDTTGIGSLRVKDYQQTGEPAAGRRSLCVMASSSTAPRCVTAGPDGEYAFSGLKPGTYGVRWQEPDTATRGTPMIEIEVRAGVETLAELDRPALGALQQSVEVRATTEAAPNEIKSSAQLISARDVNASAASLKDVSRYIQTLAGATFGTSDFNNDLVVRGGNPLENLYVLDNVEIPNINHFASFSSTGGPVGLINTELLSDITFLSGGYPAPYSNRLSSVVQMTQREGSREGVIPRLTVGFGGGGGSMEGPIGKRGSWIVSARRSFLDLFTDDYGFGGVPVYVNLQGKAVYDASAKDRFWVVSAGGWDRVTVTPDPGKESQEFDPYNFRYRGWRNAAGVNWQRVFGGTGVGLAGITFSRATVEHLASDVRLDDAVVSRQDSVENETGLKYDLTWESGRYGRVQAGVQQRFFRHRYTMDQPFGQDNPFSPAPGRVNPLFLNEVIESGQTSAYGQVTRDVMKRLSLTAGVRFERFAWSRTSHLEPRAGARFLITPRLTAEASFGLYVQQPFFLFLAADPINRGLIPMRASHTVAGITWQASPMVRLRIEAYRKPYRNYPVSLEYPQVTLATASDFDGQINYLFPMTSAGKGLARGIEVSLEKRRAGRWQGQVNVTLADSRHAALDGVLRSGAFDSRVVVNGAATYALTAKWDLAARYALLGGRPFTPFDLTLSREQNRGVFDLSRVNGVRAQAYQRLDVRVDRRFRAGGGELVVYFGAQNVFNRDNYFGRVWNFRRGEEKLLSQLGLFPIAGIEWKIR